MRTVLVLAALTVLVQAGCDDGGEKQDETGNLQLLITDPAGVPLSGAAVSTTPASQEATTDAAGKVALSGLQPGTYLVHAAGQDHQATTVELSVPAGTTSSTIRLVSTDGLVAWYLLDGDGEDVAGGHGATEVHATPGPDRFGRAGMAYTFDGTSDHLVLPPFLTETTTHLSFGAWVKPPDVEDEHCVLYNSDLAEFGLYLQADRIVYYLSTSPSTGFSSWSDAVVTAGEWQHIAVTRDGGALCAYHDGAPARCIDIGESGSHGQSGMAGAIGEIPGGRDLFAGAIDDVQVYARALSAAEVAALAQR